MSFIGKLLSLALLAPFFGGAPLRAAEFEVLDRFTVDGYSVLRGSADIPGGSFTVGASAFVVKDGKIGIGITGPGAALDIKTGAGSTYAVKVSSSDGIGSLLVVRQDGNIGIGTTAPAANLDVNGGIKVGTVTANCISAIAGTLRWYDGHMSVCNGANWRQLDNQPPPTITGINPESGIITGGTAITITGTGFNQGLEVLMDGVTATAITVVSALQITAATPARASGVKEVKIINPDGQNCVGAFTYNPFPTIAGVTPGSGPQGTAITITGTGFLTGVGVTIANISAASIVKVSDTQITAAAPASTTSGAKDVKVTNTDTGSVVLTGGFTYRVYATGGTESVSGAYRVHTFTGSATLTVVTGGTVEALVVAGGGGGGGSTAGGGGGGGVLYNSGLSVSGGTAYPVTVGAGGAGSRKADDGVPNNTNGENSVFSTLTAIGGGYGFSGKASAGSRVANSGGSGGGAGYYSGNDILISAPGYGTSGQGYSGGAVTAVAEWGGAGGGGAGGPGSPNTNPSSTRAGGIGAQYSISGTPTYYGGGGGGGVYNTEAAVSPGGAGGGGSGGSGNPTIAQTGLANTGGGGGGSGFYQAPNPGGGGGGSGIVIIRYLK